MRGVDTDGPVRWSVRRVAETGSTNADLAADAARGAPAGSVLVADSQTAGRGRLGRHWVTPPGTALAVSALFRPPAAARGRLGWLPLLTGLAVLDAVTLLAPDARLSLKWPNDVVVAGAGDPGAVGKAGGVLVQAVPGAEPGTAVVVGIGINVRTPPEQLPPGTGATSLATAGVAIDRDALLDAVLDRLERRYDAWVRGRDPVADYRARCATLGRDVVVDRSAGALTGRALDVDPAGRLVVRSAGGGTVAVDAGDVTHLRPAT